MFSKFKSHLLHLMPSNLWLHYNIGKFSLKNRSNLGHTHDHAESWCTKNDAKVVASKVGWKNDTSLLNAFTKYVLHHIIISQRHDCGISYLHTLHGIGHISQLIWGVFVLACFHTLIERKNIKLLLYFLYKNIYYTSRWKTISKRNYC